MVWQQDHRRRSGVGFCVDRRCPIESGNRDLRGLGLLNRLLVVDTDDGLLRAVDVIRAGVSAIEV
jgi:hypothetical protein